MSQAFCVSVGETRMIEFTIGSSEDGILLDRAIRKRYPELPGSVFYKALRKKDIRIDGKRIGQIVSLSAGSVVTAYITVPKPLTYEVVYENDWIFLCRKPQGLLSEPDGQGESSVLEQVQAAYPSYALCHRLDRNTGGLLFLCKQPAYTQAISDCLADRYYQKIYRAVVLGDIRKLISAKENFTLYEAHHFKDSRNKRVYVYGAPRKGTKPIRTAIRFVSYDGEKDTSEIEVLLITGRTHQIRAHMAFLGYPVAGDGKYGVEAKNRRLGYRYQALWAYCYKPADDYQGARRIIDQPIEQVLPAQTFLCPPEFR